jgi:DNA-binding FadR family transcriptional regulator
VFADRITEHERITGADAAFHRIVARASDNRALAALVDALNDQAFIERRAIGGRHVGQVRRTYERHAAILDALKQRDPDRARLLMSHHLLAIEDDFTELGGSLVPIAEGGSMASGILEMAGSDV